MLTLRACKAKKKAVSESKGVANDFLIHLSLICSFLLKNGETEKQTNQNPHTQNRTLNSVNKPNKFVSQRVRYVCSNISTKQG